MLYLLTLLFAVGFADLDDECTKGEFLVHGRNTGQNIDMNYDVSKLTIGDDDETKLTLSFTVPKRYTEQYEGNAFAITFNRKLKSTFNKDQDWDEKVVTVVEEVDDTVDDACYSNRYTNKTCTVGKNPLWTIEDSDENPKCVADASVTVPWKDVMKDTDALFGEVQIKDNGEYTEVFLTATVETWTHFREGDVVEYEGVQTGKEQLKNGGLEGADTERTGKYSGDGGDKDIDFGLDRVIIDDERYTLYQIPFILRFPKTVIVTEEFKVASPLGFLTAVTTQDVISLNINPIGDETFGTLELTFTTNIQYPYGIVGPDSDDNAMKVYIGATTDGGGTHAKSIVFVNHDDAGKCRGLKKGEICTQNFKVRITPDNDEDPCSVKGAYTFEFWAECTSGDDDDVNGCALDDLATDDDITERRKSNAYHKQTVTVAHQDFCPTLMDEIRVTGDFHVFHDEKFEEKILTGTSSNVYTNDILFFEATYRTSSLEDPIDDFSTEDEEGGDTLIDYVRAQKIFIDVTIGDDRQGNDLPGWNTDYEENFKYALGGSRIPGVSPGMDEDGGLTVTKGKDDDEGKSEYKIVLCEVAYIPADEIQTGDEKPDDCFTAPKDIATDYLDFNKVTLSKGTLNTIDENEVAFKMRLDERIIPISPPLDYSFLMATIQAEIYYKGNRHPTRRLLQAPLGGDRAQNHVMTTSFDVRRRGELEKCMVDKEQTEGDLQIQLLYPDTQKVPTVAKSPEYASSMQMQLSRFLGVRDQVHVTSVSVGDKAIYSKGRGGERRRLAEDDRLVTVNLHVTSGRNTKAGQVMNTLQDELMNGRSKIKEVVTAFSDASVTNMAVRGCRENVRKDAELRNDRLVSSASGFTALFALVTAALMAMC